MLWFGHDQWLQDAEDWGPELSSLSSVVKGARSGDPIRTASRIVCSFLLWLSRKWSERWGRESTFSRNEIVSGLYPKPTRRCWNSSSNAKSNKLMNSEAKLFHLSESVCQILKPNRAYMERSRMDPPCRHGECYWEACLPVKSYGTVLRTHIPYVIC